MRHRTQPLHTGRIDRPERHHSPRTGRGTGGEGVTPSPPPKPPISAGVRRRRERGARVMDLRSEAGGLSCPWPRWVLLCRCSVSGRWLTQLSRTDNIEDKQFSFRPASIFLQEPHIQNSKSQHNLVFCKRVAIHNLCDR